MANKVIHKSFKETRGGIEVCIEVIIINEDICINIYGGDYYHIGTVDLAHFNEKLVCTIFPNPHDIPHKDNIISEKIFRLLMNIKKSYFRNIVITSGIHIDNIKKKEFEVIDSIINSLGIAFMLWINNQFSDINEVPLL